MNWDLDNFMAYLISFVSTSKFPKSFRMNFLLRLLIIIIILKICNFSSIWGHPFNGAPLLSACISMNYTQSRRNAWFRKCEMYFTKNETTKQLRLRLTNVNAFHCHFFSLSLTPFTDFLKILVDSHVKL